MAVGRGSHVRVAPFGAGTGAFPWPSLRAKLSIIVAGEDFDARQASDVVGQRAATVRDLDPDAIAAANQRRAAPRIAGPSGKRNNVDVVSQLAVERCPRFAAVAFDLLVGEGSQIEMR